HRLPIAQRLAEVAAERPPDKPRVLDRQRLIESCRMTKRLDVLRRGIQWQQRPRRVAPQVRQRKHNQRHPPQHQQAVQETLYQIGNHLTQRRRTPRKERKGRKELSKTLRSLRALREP